jgi:hypothetical protein
MSKKAFLNVLLAFRMVFGGLLLIGSFICSNAVAYFVSFLRLTMGC